MEYIMNISDIIVLLKKNKRFVVIITLVFTIIFSCFGVVNILGKKVTQQEQMLSEERANVQSQINNNKDNNIFKTEKELLDAYEKMKENPLMDIGTNNVKYKKMIISFDERSMTDKRYTVEGWIDEIPTKKLFGVNDPILEKYRNDFIFIDGGAGEVKISIINYKKYDFERVSSIIEKKIRKNAEKYGLKIVAVSSKTKLGFNRNLFEYKDSIRNDINRINNELYSMQNATLDQPHGVKASTFSKIVKLLLCVLAGVFIGLIVGVFLLLFKIMRKGSILSERQINEYFKINELYAIDELNDDKLKILDAVVNAACKSESFLVAGNMTNENNFVFVEKLDQISDKRYIHVAISNYELETYEHINDSDFVFTIVRIGETTVKDILALKRWADTFKKEIIGYVVIK